jgi:hypothetical protein
MGQTMSSFVGFIIVFCLRLSDRAKSMFTTESKESKYYNHDIILKDDEQQAGKYIFKLLRYIIK